MPPTVLSTQPVSDPKRAIDRETVQESGKNLAHFEKLDHLRFLAAFLILFHHAVPAVLCAVAGVTCDFVHSSLLTANLSGVGWISRSIIFEGHSAVALFITLSGFLFARICGTQQIDYGRFIRNRVLRIYPMYCCAIFLASYLSPGNNGLINLCTSLLCLQNLVSPVTHELITPPLWTVAVEFQFYLLFPFFLNMFARKGAKPILLILLASIVAKLLVYWASGSVRELSYQTLFGRLDQFIVGMLAGWYYLRYEQRLRNPLFLILSGVTIISTLMLFHFKGGFWGSGNRIIWVVWPLLESLAWCSLIVTYCASTFRLPGRVSKMLCGLGAVSFSMYICHYGFAHLLAKKCAPVISKALEDSHHWLHPIVSATFQQPYYGTLLFVALVVLPIVVLFSSLTYHAIEKPFMEMRVKYKKGEV